MMQTDRRHFIGLIAASAALVSAPAVSAAIAKGHVKAVLFDGFPILDPRSVNVLAEQLFPTQGDALINLWRIRQFDYQWLRVLGNQYVDFWQATADALVFAARQLKLDLGAEKREKLMNAFLNLKAWPDVKPALDELRAGGFRLAFLANITESMLAANVKSAGLDGYFEQLISTDRIRSYKPDARAYQLGIDALHLKREEVVFVPSTGWDNAGAKWFGYQTCWINRTQSPAEELGATADAMGSSLTALTQFLQNK